MKPIYRAAVVGLGRVGCLYPEDEFPRTHVSAYLKSLRFELVAVADKDKKARDVFIECWKFPGPVYASAEELVRNEQLDVVSVCVPSTSQPQVVSELMSRPPRLLFLEKPLAVNKEGAIQLATTLQRNNISAAVNYNRSWDLPHIHFIQKVKEDGVPVAARVLYCKGMFNYASHLIAFLLQHFGPAIQLEAWRQDYTKKTVDPNFSFNLRLEAGFDVHFQGIEGVPYDVLELDIFTKNAVYSLNAAGCRRRVSRPIKGLFYSGYTQLSDESPIVEPDCQIQSFSNALDNLAAFLDDPTTSLACDLQLGLEVVEVLEAVRCSIQNGGTLQSVEKFSKGVKT